MAEPVWIWWKSLSTEVRIRVDALGWNLSGRDSRIRDVNWKKINWGGAWDVDDAHKLGGALLVDDYKSGDAWIVVRITQSYCRNKFGD